MVHVVNSVRLEIYTVKLVSYGVADADEDVAREWRLADE